MQTTSLDRSRILITGGSGFIGTNAVQSCMERGAVNIVSADVVPPKLAEHNSVWRKVDITERRAVGELFDEVQPTHLVHLGARTDLHGRSLNDYAANLQGVQNVADAAAQSRTLEASIFASSRMVCEISYIPNGDDDYCPPNFYGQSKVEGELIVRGADLGHRWTIVRPTSIWGPHFGVPYRDFFVSVLAGRYVHPRGEKIEKSFGYVGNTVHQILRLLFEPRTQVHGKTLYLADYEPLDVLDFAQEICAYSGRRRVRTVPVTLLRAAALLGDGFQRARIMKDAPLTSFRLRNLRTRMVYDLSELAAAVGPLPYTRTEGVQETLNYLGELAHEPSA